MGGQYYLADLGEPRGIAAGDHWEEMEVAVRLWGAYSGEPDLGEHRGNADDHWEGMEAAVKFGDVDLGECWGNSAGGHWVGM